MGCEPRWATPRTPSRKTLGDQAARIAVALGKPLLPWQRQVFDVALEVNEDGTPAYRDVVVTVPRQQGKSQALLTAVLHRALSRDNQEIRYAAQHGAGARAKLVDDWLPELENSVFARYFRHRLTSGHEALFFRNGSSLGLVATTQKSGHGATLDLAILDECFAHPDARVEQALRPALMTRSDAQLWVVSTAGTRAMSHYLWEKVETGRQLVEADVRTGLCYFEWSADDVADPADPATWRSCMPALGLTVSEDVVAADFAAMPSAEFQRAYLNRWTAQRTDPAIPLDAWLALTDYSSQPEDPIVLAFDVTPDRGRSAIAVAGKCADGRRHLEVVAHEAGTAWVPDRLDQLKRKHGAVAVVCDVSGPANSLLPDLARLGIDVTTVTTKEHGQACGLLYDAVVEGSVRHLGTEELTAAIDSAIKRHVGDVWLWNRRSSSNDISPLVAVTLALWGLANQSEHKPTVWSLDEVIADMRERERREQLRQLRQLRQLDEEDDQ
jgi:hypothetical protein